MLAERRSMIIPVRNTLNLSFLRAKFFKANIPYQESYDILTVEIFDDVSLSFSKFELAHRGDDNLFLTIRTQVNFTSGTCKTISTASFKIVFRIFS